MNETVRDYVSPSQAYDCTPHRYDIVKGVSGKYAFQRLLSSISGACYRFDPIGRAMARYLSF